MTAQQVTKHTQWASSVHPPLEIRMTIRMAVPNEPSSGVTTYLLFEPEFPEHIAHLLDAQIYNGVHSGLMYLKAPLPANGIEVKVLELVVLPPPEHMNTTEEIQHLGDVLGGLVTEMVRDLWSWYNDHKE